MYLCESVCKTHCLPVMLPYYRKVCGRDVRIKISNPLGEGKHSSVYDGIRVAVYRSLSSSCVEFDMSTVPQNCGMVLFSDLGAETPTLTRSAIRWAMWIACKMNFSMVIYTTSHKQRGLKLALEEHDFKLLTKTKNRRSTNTILLLSATVPKPTSKRWKQWGLEKPTASLSLH